MNLRSSIKYIYTLLSIVLVVAGICVSNSIAAPSTSIVGSKHDFSMSNQTGPGHFAGLFQVGAPAELGALIEEICVFCHTPHGAMTGNTDPVLNTRLWNRIVSPPAGFAYKPYTSSSSTLVTGNPTGISMMCMSCHDGVTSIAVNVNNQVNTPTLLNPPNANVSSAQVSLDPFQSSLPPGSKGAIGEIFKGPGSLTGWGANIGNAVPSTPGNIDMSNDHPISFDWPRGRQGYYDDPQYPELRLFGSSGRRIECATCHAVHNPSIEPFLTMSNARSDMCRGCHIK